jgi:hypothetical protein
MSFFWGYVCFSDTNKYLGERMVSVFKPMPDLEQLPDTGHPWQEQWSVNLKCLDGADAGTEVTLKGSTDGVVKAIAGLLDTVRDHLNAGGHDDKVAPIVTLESDSYPHPKYGQTAYPVLPVVDWMPLNGPAPAAKPPAPPAPRTPATPPAAAPAAAAQPRRRRIA